MSEFRSALATCLHLLINWSVFFACHKLLLIDMQLHDNNDWMIYATYNQQNVLKNITHSISFDTIDLLSHQSWTFMTQMSDGVEILSQSWVIVTVTEGRFWVKTNNESQFSAEVMTRKNTDNKEYEICQLSLEDCAIFKKRSRVSLLLWKWKNQSGQTMLRVAEWERLTDTTSVRLKMLAEWRILNDDEISVITIQTWVCHYFKAWNKI